MSRGRAGNPQMSWGGERIGWIPRVPKQFILVVLSVEPNTEYKGFSLLIFPIAFVFNAVVKLHFNTLFKMMAFCLSQWL